MSKRDSQRYSFVHDKLWPTLDYEPGPVTVLYKSGFVCKYI